MPEILKNIKAENRIDKIRIVSENDDVLGGQPALEGMEQNDSNGIQDLACTVKYALVKIQEVAEKPDPSQIQITSTFGKAKDLAASQFLANEANDNAELAKKNAATADGKAVAAQVSANEAKSAAKTADDKAVAAQTTATSALNTANNAQTAANAAGIAANNAQKSADGAQTTANTALNKANQVPNPLPGQFVIGYDWAIYTLATADQVRVMLGIKAAWETTNEINAAAGTKLGAEQVSSSNANGVPANCVITRLNASTQQVPPSNMSPHYRPIIRL